MKYIGQHDISDCGPACFAMISNYYGVRYSLQRFRELTRTGKNGTSLQGIIDGAQNLEFDAEALSGNYSELIEASGKIYNYILKKPLGFLNVLTAKKKQKEVHKWLIFVIL